LAAGDDGRATVDDVHHVNGVLVILDLAGLDAPTGVELEVTCIKEDSSLCELRLQLCPREVGGAVLTAVLRGRLYRFDADQRQLTVLVARAPPPDPAP